MIRILAALLVLLSPVSAEPRLWGIDHLGGARYPKVILDSHPDGFAFGIFTQKELFGDGFAVADLLLSKKRVPLARYNLRWSDTHTFTRKDFPKIVAEAKRGLYVINKYPLVECEISGATEHQLDVRDATELARQVLAATPERCIYVNNPWTGRGAFIAPGHRIKNEVHGRDAQRPKVGGRYNFSFDGSDAFDSNATGIKQRLNDADVFFFWTSQNNGRKNAADSTPRPQRKAWPTPDLIRALAFLATNEGATRIPPRFLWKSKSDQHVVPPAPRELKPVLIMPTSARKVDLVSDNGTVIAIASAAQPFADGRFRYYWPLFGYQMANRATALHGKPTASLRVNGKVVGTVNSGFRSGAFR